MATRKKSTTRRTTKRRAASKRASPPATDPAADRTPPAEPAAGEQVVYQYVANGPRLARLPALLIELHADGRADLQLASGRRVNGLPRSQGGAVLPSWATT